MFSSDLVLPWFFVIFSAVFVAYSLRESAVKAAAAFSAWLAGEKPDATGFYPVIALGIILAGLPVYAWFKAHGRPAKPAEPVAAPNSDSG